MADQDSDDLIAESLRNYQPIPDHLLIDWRNRLLSGETGDAAHGIAKYMIEDFCTAVMLGRQPPMITMEWIADVLGDILEDGKPEARKPFSLMPNRPGGKNQFGKHLDIAHWVSVTVSRGYEEPESIKKAAAIFFCDEKTIRRAWNEFSKGEGCHFRDDDVTADSFKQKNRPLPSPKKSGTTKK